ncbi:MAG: DNA mismatch repair protein MutS [Candidatus Kryptoniota bacterium]
MSKSTSITPLMAQYRKIKERYSDAIVLFRMGDFYETFEEDAKIASSVLSLTLTKRANGAAADVPLAGFPHHAINEYLPKLVRAGYRVAVCEQLEDPKFARGIVKRDIVEVVTPGVNFASTPVRSNNYFATLIIESDHFGMAFCDITTGEFGFCSAELQELSSYLSRVEPVEIVLPRSNADKIEATLKEFSRKVTITRRDDYIFNFDYCHEKLLHHFKVGSLKGFDLEDKQLAIRAAGAALDYISETQNGNISHITAIGELRISEFLQVDRNTRKHLEIIESNSDEGKSLLDIIDMTETAMGARQLRRILLQPLTNVKEIEKRLDAVDEVINAMNSGKNKDIFSGFPDMERLVAKVSTKRATPRDLGALRDLLRKIPEVKDLLSSFKSELLVELVEDISEENELLNLLTFALNDDLPLQVSEGWVIRDGYNKELDELRSLSINAKDWIANLQIKERERTGISSLKVDYNSVFGYYIEVTKPNLGRVPSDYIRKQTLVNAERFITPELKEYEDKVLKAEEKIFRIEIELFDELRNVTSSHAASLLKTSRAIAIIDVIFSFARAARENKYIRPTVDNSLDIVIKDGRHPVVEKLLPPGEPFVPNDIYLKEGESQIALITGPNMAGKSVFIRQVALIVLMAQAGSFVPAKEVRIGVVDRIFTRIGASDNISAGESTFMVEMQEAANILNNATPRSLVLLDEIGRGTSTFDGVSIAWAIVEYIHQNPSVAARTLFATHYHELNELAEFYHRVKNLKADVREYGGKVIFLHKIVEGGADHSYGIHVAEMAGLPRTVTSRAKEILKNLESFELSAVETLRIPKSRKIPRGQREDDLQIELFEMVDSELREKVKEIDVNNITPIEALNKIVELKRTVEGDKK